MQARGVWALAQPASTMRRTPLLIATLAAATEHAAEAASRLLAHLAKLAHIGGLAARDTIKLRGNRTRQLVLKEADHCLDRGLRLIGRDVGPLRHHIHQLIHRPGSFREPVCSH